ncbi:MAG: Rne/Rng family ribonuclease [Acidobacteria bacterium]|nr:MAG: Rne/Rng family ribonuclease [Acidobacteriota bacterium]
MQSAFVDIGLERNAFLYVSDFFDEAEELEKIMVEKPKQTVSSEEVSDEEAIHESVSPEAIEKLTQARLEHEQQIDELHEIAAPFDNLSDSFDTTVEPYEIVQEPETQNKRKRRGRKSKTEAAEEASEVQIVEIEKQEKPLFNQLERVTDEEDDETIEMFKDAYVQEAIIDQVRAVEFDMETTATADVGSIIHEIQPTEIDLQRIADEDEIEPQKSEETPKKRRSRKKKPEEANRQQKSKVESKKNSKNKKTNRKKKNLEDTEIVIGEMPIVAEMSLRRGGRRRRGSGNRRRRQSRQPENYESFEHEELEEEIAKEIAESNGKIREERRRGQPTITDLLHEGQEILVQIAKEPMARKGARITSHIALPGRYLVYMPTIEHIGVSRKIESANERNRLRNLIQKIYREEGVPSGGFIVRTAGIGASEEKLREDVRYLLKTWKDIKKQAEKVKAPALVYQDLDIVQRILRDHLSEEFTAIRVDNEEEYMRVVEFVNRIQPKLVNRVKLYTRDEPIFEAYGVQSELDKALKPRVWLKSGGYLVINQTEALVAIDVNTGKFIGKGNVRLEDTIVKTNLEAVEEIARQIRLRDLGGIIVLDLIDMEDKRNRQKVLQALQEHLSRDKSPTKIISFNDLGLVIMTRKRVKQSLERTLCSPCPYCQGSGWIKSTQTVCYRILEEAKRLARHAEDIKQVTLRVHPDVAKALRNEEKDVLKEIEDYLGPIDLVSDITIHREQFDFASI